ncbi:hypothetical protein GOP47_0023111 [Adiantum capillus-veneris]|uniref:Uncharacterized protein n=1 Tax=Adiantum capillus-veneris TaxID=13818 RepID=A0A9D4Z6M6_ADICA|nr:hypothetical protein GOP47_0023111 [Adiantum capillus-veneris]
MGFGLQLESNVALLRQALLQIGGWGSFKGYVAAADLHRDQSGRLVLLLKRRDTTFSDVGTLVRCLYTPRAEEELHLLVGVAGLNHKFDVGRQAILRRQIECGNGGLPYCVFWCLGFHQEVHERCTDAEQNDDDKERPAAADATSASASPRRDGRLRLL